MNKGVLELPPRPRGTIGRRSSLLPRRRRRPRKGVLYAGRGVVTILEDPLLQRHEAKKSASLIR